MLATWLTVVRCTPSIMARNSWVSCISSPSSRSWQTSSHRQKRSSTSCRALQATDCWALARRASQWRRMTSRRSGEEAETARSRSALIRETTPADWPMMRLKAVIRVMPASRPTALSEPTVAVSTAAPSSMTLSREITPVLGK